MRFSHAVSVAESPISRGRTTNSRQAPRFRLAVAGDSGHRLAVIVALALLFVIQSRFSELMVIRFGGQPYLGKVLSLAGIVLIMFTGGGRRAISSRQGVLFILLTGMFLLSLPFSIWKGGSADLLYETWLKSLAFFFILAGSIESVSECRAALYAIALSGVLNAVQAPFFASESSGRLQLDLGSLANPNELAFTLLLGVPCSLLIVLRARRSPARIGGGLLAGLLVLSAVQTGSRGGLIVLAAMLVFLFFTGSTRVRIIGAGATVALIALGLALAPEHVLDRYQSLTSAHVNENEEASWEAQAAVGSSESRIELLKQSVLMTLRHPLVGVGPGMFPAAVAEDFNASSFSDEAPAWRATHNAYTQISSECGIPALALFLGILVYSLRTTVRIYRKSRNRAELAEAAACAYCLLLALIAFAVNGFFMSNAYAFALPMLAALTASLERAAAALERAPIPHPAG